MITNQNPVIHADFSDALKANPHLQDGKFGKFDTNGKIALASTAADAIGIICSPDSHSVAVAGNATGADICLRSFGGIIQAQCGTLSASVSKGQMLSLGEDARVSDAEGTPVAVAAEDITATTAGQLVRVVMLPFSAPAAETEEGEDGGGSGSGDGSGSGSGSGVSA